MKYSNTFLIALAMALPQAPTSGAPANPAAPAPATSAPAAPAPAAPANPNALPANFIAGLNAGSSGMIAKINALLPAKLKSTGMDPLKPIAGKVEKNINIAICKISLKASYSVTNIKGISTLQIATMSYKSGTSVNGVMNLETTSTVVPFGITGDLEGTASVGCGIPDIKLTGTVTGNNLAGSMVGPTTLTIKNLGTDAAPKMQANITSMKIESFAPKFESVIVKLKDLPAAAEVVSEGLQKEIEKDFHNQILAMSGPMMKGQVEEATAKQLPWAIDL